MPTVFWLGRLRVVIYMNDHRPAHVHVHVLGRGHEAVFLLNCPAGPAELRQNYGFSRSDVAHMHAPLQKNLAMLCAAWENHHGTS